MKLNLIDLILENQALFSLLSEEGRESVLRSKFIDSKLVNDYVFNKILDTDPTRNKTYSQWLLNQYVKTVVKPFPELKPGQFNPEKGTAQRVFLEDLNGIEEALLVFDRFKKRFSEKDINKYTIPKFKKVALEVQDTLSDIEKSASGEHRFSADEAKFPEYKIGTVDGYTVWKLPQKNDQAEEAACELGKNTSWCTRNGAFKTYNRKDPLYIFIGKGTKYQFHFSDNQFMNRVDSPMPEGPLKDSFLKFLEDHEGRVKGSRDISQYKIGEYDSPEGKLPIYKVGQDKYYTKIGGKEVFYNPDDKLLKTKEGKTISDPGVIFTHPYMDFLKEVYRRFKESGDTKKFHNIYRLLLNLDVPQKGLDEWFILNSLNLQGSDLTQLPNSLHILGDLDLTDSKIEKLPSKLKVDGNIIGGPNQEK